MKKNVVIRRQALTRDDAYYSVVKDFKEAFGEFEGVSFEEFDTVYNDDGTTDREHMVIYLDKNKKLSLKIFNDSTYIIKASINCGTGSTEGENVVFIDSRTKSDYISYNIALTDYGVAFSVFPYVIDSKKSLSDGYIQCFFTTFENTEGKELNGFVYCANPNDGTDNSKSYLMTEEHDRLEIFQPINIFNGENANHTVLLNAVSYAKPLMCRHLFKKFQTENSKFGRVKLNGKTFISGSHFCLEGKDE